VLAARRLTFVLPAPAQSKLASPAPPAGWFNASLHDKAGDILPDFTHPVVYGGGGGRCPAADSKVAANS